MAESKEKVTWITPEIYQKDGNFWYVTVSGKHIRIGDAGVVTYGK